MLLAVAKVFLRSASDRTWALSAKARGCALRAERFFNAAVEEIRDVGVLLGFGAAEVLQILLGENLREDVRDFFGAIT